MAHLSVVIDGKTYRMACDEGQDDHLRMLAEKLDHAIQTLKEGFGDIGDQRLAIMAGIMMADELFEANRRVKGLEAELDSLRESRGALVDRYQSSEETLAQALQEIAGRVEGIVDRLARDDRGKNREKTAAE